VIIVLDAGQAEDDLARGVIGCPRCGGSLWPWSWAKPRRVRLRDGARLVRPRRARCASCRATQVLLPSWCLPRRADAAEVIGAALVAKADGHGYRSIAKRLDRPPSTVRAWLRRARGEHVAWLRRRGVQHAAALDPHILGEELPAASPLGEALTALSTAVLGYRRRVGRHADTWALVGAFTTGRLLAPW
jgi:transposase-like protein